MYKRWSSIAFFDTILPDEITKELYRQIGDTFQHNPPINQHLWKFLGRRFLSVNLRSGSNYLFDDRTNLNNKCFSFFKHWRDLFDIQNPNIRKLEFDTRTLTDALDAMYFNCLTHMKHQSVLTHTHRVTLCCGIIAVITIISLQIGMMRNMSSIIPIYKVFRFII
jgi:hypothetical protein